MIDLEEINYNESLVCGSKHQNVRKSFICRSVYNPIFGTISVTLRQRSPGSYSWILTCVSFPGRATPVSFHILNSLLPLVRSACPFLLKQADPTHGT